MPEVLTIPLAIDLAVCVAIAAVFYGFLIWSAIAGYTRRDEWRSPT